MTDDEICEIENNVFDYIENACEEMTRQEYLEFRMDLVSRIQDTIRADKGR